MNGADVFQDLREGLLRQITEAEQISISSGADRLAEPYQHQQGSLEDEPVSVGRSREAIEEAFRAVAGEHKVRVETDRLCMLHEPGVHGSWEALAGGGHATSASR